MGTCLIKNAQLYKNRPEWDTPEAQIIPMINLHTCVIRRTTHPQPHPSPPHPYPPDLHSGQKSRPLALFPACLALLCRLSLLSVCPSRCWGKQICHLRQPRDKQREKVTGERRGRESKKTREREEANGGGEGDYLPGRHENERKWWTAAQYLPVWYLWTIETRAKNFLFKSLGWTRCNILLPKIKEKRISCRFLRYKQQSSPRTERLEMKKSNEKAGTIC